MLNDGRLERLFAPLRDSRLEMAVFALFDPAGNVLGLRHCTSASLLQIDVSITTIASDAIAFRASQAAMAHNHPSGDPAPSQDDLVVTRRIAAALDALGVRLFDHLVIAGAVATSLRASGQL